MMNAVSMTTSTWPATMLLWPTMTTASTWSAVSTPTWSLSRNHAPVSTTLTQALLLNIPQPSPSLYTVNHHPQLSPLQLMTQTITPTPLFRRMVPGSLYQQAFHWNLIPDTYYRTFRPSFRSITSDWKPRPPFQPSDDRHYWVSRLRYTGQGSRKFIRFCSKCNVVWPLAEQLSAMVCKGSRLFQKHEETFFECYKCSSWCHLEDIGSHLALIHHDLHDPNDDGEQYMSYLCMICKTMLYGKWQVFIHHRMKMHYDTHLTVDKRQPTVMIIMSWLMRDFLAKGREVLMYACMVCKHYGTNAHNRNIFCEVCQSSGNKYYCKYCNVIFSSQQSGYEIHLHTYEHYYIKTFGPVPNTASPVLNGRHRGGRRELEW